MSTLLEQNCCYYPSKTKKSSTIIENSKTMHCFIDKILIIANNEIMLYSKTRL